MWRNDNKHSKVCDLCNNSRHYEWMHTARFIQELKPPIVMVQIGVLTFSNNENRGALLQAYCVKKILEENIENSTVDVVDYRTRSKEWNRICDIFVKHPKKLPLLPERIRDARICNKFSSEELANNHSRKVTNNHGEAVEWLEKQNYDLLVTGSDEVWKMSPERNGINKITNPNRPFPNLYFLDPSLSAITASYAASSNTTNIDALTRYKKETFKHHIANIDYISVRDEYTKEVLADLGINNVSKVPDPTLMTEIPTGNGRKILSKEGINLSKPILNVHSEEHPLIKNICKQYREEGYQIVSTRSSPYADVNMIGKVDPFEYYSLYDHFDMVVTTSLHSTIFSIKNNTSFLTVDTDEIYHTVESKTESLLRDLDLLNRHIEVENTKDSIQKAELEKYENDLNSNQIEKKIRDLQKQGHEYLQQVEERISDL